jgi:hypothetical protein
MSQVSAEDDWPISEDNTRYEIHFNEGCLSFVASNWSPNFVLNSSIRSWCELSEVNVQPATFPWNLNAFPRRPRSRLRIVWSTLDLFGSEFSRFSTSSFSVSTSSNANGHGICHRLSVRAHCSFECLTRRRLGISLPTPLMNEPWFATIGFGAEGKKYARPGQGPEIKTRKWNLQKVASFLLLMFIYALKPMIYKNVSLVWLGSVLWYCGHQRSILCWDNIWSNFVLSFLIFAQNRQFHGLYTKLNHFFWTRLSSWRCLVTTLWCWGFDSPDFSNSHVSHMFQFRVCRRAFYIFIFPFLQSAPLPPIAKAQKGWMGAP